jgi:hypothetical protein
MAKEDLQEAGTLYGTNLEMELWYHEKDGTISRLPKINHDYYAKKPDFHTAPTPLWHERNKNNVQCPVPDCPSPNIRVKASGKDAAHVELSKLLGAPIGQSVEIEQRNATLAHMQAFHPQIFVDLVRQGVLTMEQAKLLRMGT